ncbi:hypothetical protein [Sunxiuqinia sp. sy24]|uniref:hypothetical protein n=1 Tax=Sunxiuqinia sp. sy24 TaxID=3461495 RepID=UPI004045A7C2
MNTTVIFILFFIISISLSGQETPKASPISKPKANSTKVEDQSKSNHTISVQGESNVVKIEKGNTKTDSLSATHHIDINGTYNVVKIREAEGTVSVKQTGHGNQVSITQNKTEAHTKKQQQKYKLNTKDMKRSPPK